MTIIELWNVLDSRKKEKNFVGLTAMQMNEL
jgi:hypothetical protein